MINVENKSKRTKIVDACCILTTKLDNLNKLRINIVNFKKVYLDLDSTIYFCKEKILLKSRKENIILNFFTEENCNNYIDMLSQYNMNVLETQF